MTFERVAAHCLSISRHLLESTVNLRSPWVASYMAWAELVRSVNLSYYPFSILSLSILNGKLHSIHATVLLSICCRYLKRSFKQHHHYQVSSSLNSGCRLRRLGPMAVIDSSSQAPVLGLTIESSHGGACGPNQGDFFFTGLMTHKGQGTPDIGNNQPWNPDTGIFSWILGHTLANGWECPLQNSLPVLESGNSVQKGKLIWNFPIFVWRWKNWRN